MAKLPAQVEMIDFKLPIGIPEGIELLVKADEKVEKGQVLCSLVTQKVKRYSVATVLKLKKPEDAGTYLAKKIGDLVATGELLANRKDWLGSYTLHADASGTVLEITEQGEVVIGLGETVTEIASPMTGKVVGVQDGVIEIQSNAYQVRGAAGWGACRWGNLVLKGVNQEHSHLEQWNVGLEGKVVAFRGMLTPAYWFKAAALGVAGIWCDEIPSNFETWMGSSKMYQPSLVAFSDTGEKTSDDVWEWVAKCEGHLCFLLPDTKEVIVLKD